MGAEERLLKLEAASASFKEEVETYGLSFEEGESQPRCQRREAAATAHARCENNDASLSRGWMSSACVACRKGEETATFFVSLKCTRSCYFCFNPNQERFAYYCQHERDIAGELQKAYSEGKKYSHVAVTGGEPCLHPKELCDFLETAKKLYPHVHARLYTSGDRLTDRLLQSLAALGLDEIRFSIKQEEGRESIEQQLKLIGDAVGVIPAVMVEMPVIPGTIDEMKTLLHRLDALGVRGINLLEFCFPLFNGDEFRNRGFKIRARPYEILYDYWYAGGLPVAGSETEALELLRYADERGLRMGVHYCSLDNKLTGQVYQQNKVLLSDSAGRLLPWLSMDEVDYFAKCTKVYGEDVERTTRALEKLSDEGVLAVPFDLDAPQACYLNECGDELLFPLPWAECVHAADESIALYASFNMIEACAGAPCPKEVALLPLSFPRNL